MNAPISKEKINKVRKYLRTMNQKEAAKKAGVSHTVAWNVYHGNYNRRHSILEIKQVTEPKYSNKVFNVDEHHDWIF